MDNLYQIFREIILWATFFLSIVFFVKFFPWMKILTKDNMRMIKIVISMWGKETVNRRIADLDVQKVQSKNRALIGKKIKEKIPLGVFNSIPDEEIVASLTDKKLMDPLFYLAEKTGIKDFIFKGEEKKKKKRGFYFE